ncbi:hypothetical protein [Nocardia farcinica]|uniref:hypothetical protein n=1 Tax=Nocardia farcinica TaxID=37329 RepID=UPI0024564ECC|nr:hypothetical protein [Nocardia farcinica]
MEEAVDNRSGDRRIIDGLGQLPRRQAAFGAEQFADSMYQRLLHCVPPVHRDLLGRRP